MQTEKNDNSNNTKGTIHFRYVLFCNVSECFRETLFSYQKMFLKTFLKQALTFSLNINKGSSNDEIFESELKKGMFSFVKSSTAFSKSSFSKCENVQFFE